MLKSIKFNIVCVVVVAIYTFTFNSCVEDDENEVITKTKLFRPSFFKASPNANIIHFTWTPIGGATYRIEISTTNDFQSNLKFFEIESEREYNAEDLLSNTLYYCRIKAISIDKNIQDSEWYKTVTVTTQQENVFSSVKADDIGYDRVFFTWDSVRTVTRIVVLQGTTTVAGIPLTPQEVFAGKKEITGLTPNTDYTFRIYNGDTWLRGTQTAKTKGILLPVAPEDIGSEHIVFRWVNIASLTELKVGDKTIPLSGSENGQIDVTGLKPETVYAVSLLNGSLALGSISVTTAIAGGDILLAAESGDIGSDRVIIRWNSNTKKITHIIVSAVNSDDITVTLTDSDRNAYRKTITGLSPGVEYDFRIYNGDLLRGTVRHTTLM